MIKERKAIWRKPIILISYSANLVFDDFLRNFFHSCEWQRNMDWAKYLFHRSCIGIYFAFNHRLNIFTNPKRIIIIYIMSVLSHCTL